MVALYEDDGVGGATRKIIGAAITVHRHLGPGLYESAYELCFVEELKAGGLHVRRQVPVPLEYRTLYIPKAYRLDLLVNDEVVVEIKVVRKLTQIHVAQVLTYLRLMELRVGLLFNFNVEALVAGGLKRVLREH